MFEFKDTWVHQEEGQRKDRINFYYSERMFNTKIINILMPKIPGHYSQCEIWES